MTNNIYILLLFMFFFHVVDDYYLQGILASMKQKSWWQQNAPDEMYKYDYVMALCCHAFSWAFMINLPILLYTILFGGKWNLLFIIINTIIHAVTDDIKANKKEINLIQDQCVHFAQIIFTFLFWIGIN